jgi:hypothetical protein
MNNQKQGKGIDLGFTKEHFPEGIHMCLIYDQDDERQKIVSEYMAAGLRQGEQVRYFTDITEPEDIRSWLLEAGVELPQTRENGPFSILKAENGYCPNGRFDPQEMIGRMLPRYKSAQEAGYSGLRSCGEMTWTLKGIPGSERLLEYEVLLGTVVANFPHSGMCQYDARIFDGATLFNVLKVHPWMVVRGKIIQNPYYMSPQEFLKDSKPKQ